VVHFSGIAPTSVANFAGATLQAGGTPSMTAITISSGGALAAVIFPAGLPGNYMIVMTVAGSTSASALALSSLGTGGTALNILTQSNVRDATDTVSSLAGTTTAPAVLILTFTLSNAGTTVSINCSTVVGATGAMDLFIYSLPSSVLTVAQKEIQEIEDLHAQVRELQRSFASLSHSAIHPERVVSNEPPSPDEFKTTDCAVVDLKPCVGCQERSALIGSIYCHRCAQRIGAKRDLKVAWNPDS
jgi:hypothetical protein